MRTSRILDAELVNKARKLGIDVSAAAQDGLRKSIRRHRAERDKAAYLAHTENEDPKWDAAEASNDV